MISIKVPPLGESIVEATVSRWLKKEGDAVAAGDTLVELETDKITVEVPAMNAGVLTKRAHAEGDVVKVDELLGRDRRRPRPQRRRPRRPTAAPAPPAPATAAPQAAPQPATGACAAAARRQRAASGSSRLAGARNASPPRRASISRRFAARVAAASSASPT